MRGRLESKQTWLDPGRSIVRIISHCCSRSDVGRRIRPAILGRIRKTKSESEWCRYPDRVTSGTLQLDQLFMSD